MFRSNGEVGDVQIDLLGGIWAGRIRRESDSTIEIQAGNSRRDTDNRSRDRAVQLPPVERSQTSAHSCQARR